MPLSTWNVDWLNLNAQRKYPLAADSPGTDLSGSFTIPDDFILEMALPVHAGIDVEPGRFFVLNIGAYASGYSIVIGYQPVSGPAIPVATALIARQTHTRNKGYALGGIDPFSDTVGKVTIGKLDSIDLQPPGFYTFDLDGATIEPDCVRPIIRGLSSITLVNGTRRSVPLNGDIELIAGCNIQLTPILITGQDPIIRIDAISGAGLTEECICIGDNPVAPPIETINGVKPTPTGDFILLGDDCLQVLPITNGVKLVDVCSKPCCGCVELETITRDLERLLSESKAVEEFLNRLQAEVTTMDTMVLGARLGDRGCISGC